MLEDSGERIASKTGGLREPKPERFDLMSPVGLYRLARHYANGAKKYGDHNWEKGVDYSGCINAIFRHTIKFMLGSKDEDHLAAIAWNAFALMEYEVACPELNDLEHLHQEEILEWIKERL
jgi:hypothetical protein